MKRRALVTLAAVLLTGCQDATEPELTIPEVSVTYQAKPSDPVVVDEDFEDGVADGFFTGTGGLFDGAQLGTVIDDGTGSGNKVYQMQEALRNQAFVSPEALRNFDLTFDATFLPGGRFGSGAVGILFRADPDGADGYFFDSGALFVRRASGDELIGVAGGFGAAGDFKVRLRAIGARIEVFLDGRLRLLVIDPTYRSGHVGLVEVNEGTIQVDNIVLRRIRGSQRIGR